LFIRQFNRRFPKWGSSLLTRASVATLLLLVTGLGSAGAAGAGGSSIVQSVWQHNVDAQARPTSPRVRGPRNTTNQSPVYRFSARERGVPSAAIHFRCAVDSAPLQGCARRYHAHLTVGSHVLAVLAVDRKGRKSHIVRVQITVTQPLGPGAQVVTTIQMPDPVTWIAADPSSVWVHEPDSVARVSTASNTVVAQIPTPPIQDGFLASGEGAVWQANFSGSSLLRIDPAANTVVATIPLGGAPEGVAVADGSVWVAMHEDGTVLRIDPATNAIVKTITVGPPGSSGPYELAAGAAGVWVTVPNETQVVHIDPSTNTVVGHVDVDGKPIVDGTNVWIETVTGLERIDPTTAKIVAHTTLGPNGWGAAGLGSVWVTTPIGLARVDETTNQLVGLLPNIPKGDIAIAAGSVWLAAFNDTKLLRIQPVG
jgi:virginiamycin B lyase